MKQRTEICVKCNKGKIVNRTKNLCNDCNKERLNTIKENSRFNHKVEKDLNIVILKEKEEHPINSKRYFSNNRNEEYQGKTIKILSIEGEFSNGVKQYKIQILETGDIVTCTEWDIVKKLKKDKTEFVAPQKEKITYNRQEKEKITKLVQETKSSLTEQQRKSLLEASLLKKIKDEITDLNLKNGTYYCRGCGTQSEHLDRSHILSVAQRQDLKFDKENIDLLCRYCHMKWESGNKIGRAHV